MCIEFTKKDAKSAKNMPLGVKCKFRGKRNFLSWPFRSLEATVSALECFSKEGLPFSAWVGNKLCNSMKGLIESYTHKEQD